MYFYYIYFSITEKYFFLNISFWRVMVFAQIIVGLSEYHFQEQA